MCKSIWSALMLVAMTVAGTPFYVGILADTPRSANAITFICPITGEGLLCERCCPLNQGKASEGAASVANRGQGCCHQ